MSIVLRELGTVAYESTVESMRKFTDGRDEQTPDELWLLQHPPVFTQGQAGKSEHILMPGDIPVIQSDRGGQVTYHGPGQWVVYLLIDLRRRNLGVRDLVDLIENCIVRMLDEFEIVGQGKSGAPGVYVRGEKIASLGLRVRRGCSYHGLAVNVDMDLEPFARINPCGYEGLSVTSMAKLLSSDAIDSAQVGTRLLNLLNAALISKAPL